MKKTKLYSGRELSTSSSQLWVNLEILLKVNFLVELTEQAAILKPQCIWRM